MKFIKRHWWWMAALGALAYLATPRLSCRPIPAAVASSQQIISQCRIASEGYRLEYSHYPPSDPVLLSRVLRGEAVGAENPRHIAFIELSPRHIAPTGKILDGWGTALRFHFPTDGSPPEITSAGKDRQWGTADDLSSLR